MILRSWPSRFDRSLSFYPQLTYPRKSALYALRLSLSKSAYKRSPLVFVQYDEHETLIVKENKKLDY